MTDASREPAPPPREGEGGRLAEQGRWLAEGLAQTREFGVIRLAADGTIIGWYGAAASLFGYADAEVLGRPFELIFTPEDRSLGIPALELAVAAKSPRSEDDRWHLRKDGSRFWGSGVLSQLPGGAGLDGFVKVLRDRTDLRMRYLAMQSRLDGLAREVAAQREALLTLVHEARNPLSPLNSASELLRHPLPEAHRLQLADLIARQVGLLRELLERARAGAEGRPPAPRHQRLVVQQALQTVVDDLAADAAAKGLRLQLIVSAEPMLLDADPLQLHQMASNLVSNAVKYTPAGGRVSVSATIEGDLMAIRVEDDGIGIDKDNLERIFELFVREGVGEGTGQPVQGSGIGLALVKRLATLHGGFVEARSSGRGQGSRFTLQLPLRQPLTSSVRNTAA